MLMPVLALALLQNVCPITIGVGKDGGIFSDRFHGWYKTAPKTLDGVLRGGCYNDNNPSPITSVRLVVAAGAPKLRIDLVLTILKNEGWGHDRLVLQSWDQYPSEPH